MRSRIGFLGLAFGLVGACTVSDSELVGARCDSGSFPCGRGTLLVCNPATQRCVLRSDAGAGGGGGAMGGGGGGTMGGGGGGGGGGARCTLQPFEPMDEFTPSACQLGLAMSVTTVEAPEPWVIVAGMGLGCGGAGGRITQRTFHDGGWTTANDSVTGERRDPVLAQIAATPDGGLVLVGEESDSLPDGGVRRSWRVWRRPLGSAAPLESFDAPDAAGDSWVRGIAVEPSGRLFVAGGRENALVLRRHDGAGWVDAYVDTRPSGCTVAPVGGVAVDRSGTVYVAGSETGSLCGVTSNQRGFTSTFINGGTQQFGGLDSWDGGLPRAIAATADGTVFTVGGTDGFPTEWIVRRGLNSGTTWEELDRWQLAPGQNCLPVGVTAGDAGVWVVGTCTNDAGFGQWVVRSYRDGAWSTDDVYGRSQAGPSVAVSVAVDPRGTVYVAGYGDDGTGTRRWLVRSAQCQ